jgi:hypothetical protein
MPSHSPTYPQAEVKTLRASAQEERLQEKSELKDSFARCDATPAVGVIPLPVVLGVLGPVKSVRAPTKNIKIVED